MLIINEEFKAVLIGAGAMKLLGLLNRKTVDLDILDPKIPSEILIAASEFRSLKESQGIKLQEKWINNGPTSLLD